MFRKPAQFTFYFLLQNIVEIHCLRIIFIWNCMAEGSTIIFSVLTFVEKKIASKVRGSETQNCEDGQQFDSSAFHWASPMAQQLKNLPAT